VRILPFDRVIDGHNPECVVPRPIQFLPPIGVGESMPLRDRSIDLVYARQLLHDAIGLLCLLSECARVLKPGGALLACRTVDNEDQLEESS